MTRGDRVFGLLLSTAGAATLGLVALVALLTLLKAWPALSEWGLGLLLGLRWAPSEAGLEYSSYGLLPAIAGTLAVALIALVLALPSALVLALWVEGVLPRRLGALVDSVLVVLAGLPTIIYGLWGSSVLAPLLQETLLPGLHGILGWVPLFSCEPLTGRTILTAGILLALMVTPFTFALVREALSRIPQGVKEALWALGSTRLEYSLHLARMIRPSLLAGGLIAFGRAAGETVAVALVVGNSYTLPVCVNRPGVTVSALIANQFPESSLYPLMESTLYAGGLVLLALGALASAAGMIIQRRMSRDA